MYAAPWQGPLGFGAMQRRREEGKDVKLVKEVYVIINEMIRWILKATDFKTERDGY